MIKKWILLTAFVLMFMGTNLIQAKSPKKIQNGLYLITKIDTVENKLSKPAPNEMAISFNKEFEDYTSDGFIRLIIDTSDFVPLELDKAPKAEQQTDSKKKLLLSLTKSASGKLKTFTAKHIMERVAIVVDGEALTMHKIRVAITSGELQVTRCNDNACEMLSIKLKDNIKK